MKDFYSKRSKILSERSEEKEFYGEYQTNQKRADEAQKSH